PSIEFLVRGYFLWPAAYDIVKAILLYVIRDGRPIDTTRRVSMETKPKGAEAVEAFGSGADGQVVLVLQGGGALGAYQVGVYEALQEAGVEPDWIIGTSIGAINASLIAGNPPERRLQALREFWARVQGNHAWDKLPAWTGI